MTVVVGGGVVGMASAYSLATRGQEAVVCEQGTIGSGSTERSAGGIRAQFSTPVNVDLSVEVCASGTSSRSDSVSISGIDRSAISLARSTETAESSRENVSMQQARGVPSELLDPDIAREYCPELHADQFRAATYSPTDGFADPYLVLQGYATAAREAGVDIRTNTPVTAIHREGGDGDDGRVVDVDAGGDRIEATHVVNAAGPWASRVGTLADLTLPIAPRRRQALVVASETDAPETTALTIDLDTGSYYTIEG